VDSAPAVAFLGVLLIRHGDFLLATWFLVGGSTLALIVNLIVEGRIAPLPAVSGILALVFGGLTILLKDKSFVQMKMTIVDGLLGAALFGGLLMGKNPLKAILGGAFTLSDGSWRVLAVRYGLFWWASAVANEWVRRTQTAEIWAMFRVAAIVAAVVFAIAQTPFLMRHARETGPATPEPPDPGF
jgi:intracellular septation protein